MSHVRHELRAVSSEEGDKTSDRVCRYSGLFAPLWQSLHTLEPQIHPKQSACLRNCLLRSCSHCSKCAQGLVCKRFVRDCLKRKRRGHEVTLYSERKMLKKVGAACVAFHHLWKAFLKADTASNFLFCSKVLILQMAASWHSHPLCERIAEITRFSLSLWY